MAKDKVKEFNKSVKNFYARMDKYSTIKGATYSAKFYDIEDEIRSAKRGEKDIEEITNKLNDLKGQSERELINVYNPVLDRMTPLGDNYIKGKEYKHDLYELDLSDISNIIADNPDLFKQDDISQETYEEYYRSYDTTLLHELWDWLDRRPIGIVAEIQFDLAKLIRDYGEEVVSKYINERQDEMPLLNSNTGYNELVDLQHIISDISQLIGIDESRSKRMSEQVEQYDNF